MTLKERIPLLRDHHTHPCLYASLAGCPDLRFVDDRRKALEMIRDTITKDEINVAIGWNDSLYRFSPAELDPFPPIVVMNASLHSFVMNRAAREELAPRHPELIANLEDREWIERNADLLLGFVMGIRGCDAARIRQFYDQLASQGIWYAEEMTLRDAGEMELFDKTSLSGRSRFWADMGLFKGMEEDAAACVRGIKVFADGALGARTAKLSVPYPGGGEGILIHDDEKLLDRLALAAYSGKDVAVHAIGDQAIEQVVDAVARLEKRSPATRIEHCQFITLESARRAKSLGIVLSMQPNFSFESNFYRDRLPDPYPAMNNPFRMLIDEAGFVPGEDLIFGSDGMPHGAPYALQSALFPPFPGQRLSLPEFVAGYCMPDFTHGFIDLTIDREKQSVTTKVTLK